MTASIDSNFLNKYLTDGDSKTLLEICRQADADANPRCIAGAVYRNPEKMDEWVKELPAGKLAVVYCAKGARSARACPNGCARRALKSMLPASWKNLTATRNGCKPSWETINPTVRAIYAHRR